MTINYSTQDSTAIAGTDYTGVSNGKLIFQPGVLVNTISIPIFNDTVQKKNLVFYINLTSATNGILPGNKIRVLLLNVTYANLMWSDEFNAATLNTAIWNYDLGNNGGWGNNELETYTNSTNNVYLANGYLNITATQKGSVYSSGRITTEGNEQFTNGRVDIRAKLPKGQGLWPALWMLGSDFPTAGWPECGEIDIMELLGQQPNMVHGSAHCGTASNESSATQSFTLSSGAFSDTFHIFSLIWTPNYLHFLIDNNNYFTVDNNDITGFPMNLPEFFIFNVAVGGYWPGPPDSTTVFPQTMSVDYVRVYQ